MCTVTYIPKKEGFIFTSSRDEKYNRRDTEFPVTENKLVFPRDLKAKGTWIASNSKRLACLLNGGFIKHQRKIKYKKSRGLMLLDSFKFPCISSFTTQYNFHGMEPFTLICVDDENVHEIRWDDFNIHHSKKSLSQKHIWSSSTLYSPEIIVNREIWFDEWYDKKNNLSLEYCREFHYSAGKQDAFNSVFLKRVNKGTISITSIERSSQVHKIVYDDLINPTRNKNILK